MESAIQNKHNTKSSQPKGVIRNFSTASDPQLVRSFRGHTGQINSVSFDSQMYTNLYQKSIFRKQVASCSNDGTVQIWSFKPQQRPFKFIGHKGAVYDVQISPNNKVIASGGEDRQIRLWQNSVQAKCYVLNGHTGAIKNIHFSTNGELLLTSSCDKTMKIWKTNDIKKPSFLFALSGHKNWIKSGQFAPDTRIICSGSDDKTVRLWDVDTRKQIHNYDYHQDGVNQVKFSPDGTCVSSCSKDRSIKIFDTRSHKLIQHYEQENEVNTINFHPSGYFLASGGQGKKLLIWDLRMGKLSWTLHAHENHVKSVAFNQGGDYFVSGGGDNLVMIWKTNFDDDIDVTQVEENQEGSITQTLIKSNKKYQNSGKKSQNIEQDINTYQDYEEEQVLNNKENQSDQRPQISNPMLEKLSGPLEKIVNQLDQVSQAVRSLDSRLSDNEKEVKGLLQNPIVQNIINKGENVFAQSLQSGSYWETFKANENQVQGIFAQSGTNQFASESQNIFSTGALVNSDTKNINDMKFGSFQDDNLQFQ